ncbi:MAG: hypothetical protein JXR03_02315 [Cyclobacteriaceae bacterium]
MKKIIYLSAIFVTMGFGALAQLSMKAEVRPRTELYNGNNSTLATKDQRWGVATQQRTRFSIDYKADGLSLVFSPQLINFWGQMPQAYDLLGDGAPGSPEANFSVFEAYGAYKFSDMFTLKFGRQAISYGDQRWFGALGWAASGRAHDAMIGKFSFGDVKLDVGVALNQTKHTNKIDSAAIASIRSGYKSLQYGWLSIPAGDLKLQAMVTNVTTTQRLSSTAVSYDQTTTLGLLPSFSTGDIAINASGYYQTSGDTRSAYLVAADFTYKGLGIPLTIGADIVSGDDESTPESETWIQPFGTNHKFYGFMDFFYVGETPKFGLNDFYLKSVIKTGEKTKLIAFAHYFSTNQDFTSGTETISGTLGTEVDLVYNINVAPAFNIKLGYSKLFADKNFESFKPGDSGAGNQWAWLQLTLNPTLLKSE